MESIPLINSISDIRNLFSLLFYSCLIYLVRLMIKNSIASRAEIISCNPSLGFDRMNSNNNNDRNKIPNLVCCSSQQPRNPVNGSILSLKCKSKRGNSAWKQQQQQQYNHHNNGFNENNNCICACDSSRNIWPHPYNFPFSWNCNSSSSISSSSLSSSCSSRDDSSSAKSYSSSESSPRKSSVQSLSNRSQLPWNQERLDGLWMAVAFLIIPFIPATNAFFYVGFVVAGL